MENQNLSGNFNTLWLQNIFENIKNIESYERILREGADNLIDVLNIPLKERDIQLALAQYKALQMYATELLLLCDDAKQVIKEDFFTEAKEIITNLYYFARHENLFITKIIDQQKRRIISVQLKDQFYETLEVLNQYKVDIISQAKDWLFAKSTQSNPSLNKTVSGVLSQ